MIQELFMNRGVWTDISVKALGEAIKANPNLTEIRFHLANTNIGNTGAQALSEGIKGCPNLTSIMIILAGT